MATAVTSAAAIPHAPRDDLNGITEKQRRILDRACSPYREHRMFVYSLLVTNNWDEGFVDDAMETLLGHFKQKMSNEHVARYLGYEPCGAPKPCTVLLEDGRGGVARDVNGFPLCVSFGIGPKIDTQTAMSAAAWMSQRVRSFAADSEVPQTTNVVDLLCRRHLDEGKTIPTPDPKCLEMSSLLPNARTKTYVCGATEEMRAMLNTMGSVPLLKRYVDSFVLCDDYSALRGVVPPEHMLPWWGEGASYDFDIDKYAAYLRSA
jgi:hypothetical protein